MVQQEDDSDPDPARRAFQGSNSPSRPSHRERLELTSLAESSGARTRDPAPRRRGALVETRPAAPSAPEPRVADTRICSARAARRDGGGRSPRARRTLTPRRSRPPLGPAADSLNCVGRVGSGRASREQRDDGLPTAASRAPHHLPWIPAPGRPSRDRPFCPRDRRASHFGSITGSLRMAPTVQTAIREDRSAPGPLPAAHRLSRHTLTRKAWNTRPPANDSSWRVISRRLTSISAGTDVSPPPATLDARRISAGIGVVTDTARDEDRRTLPSSSDRRGTSPALPASAAASTKRAGPWTSIVRIASNPPSPCSRADLPSATRTSCPAGSTCRSAGMPRPARDPRAPARSPRRHRSRTPGRTGGARAP